MKHPTYTHVIYHGRCPDGFGAAWAAWKALGEKAKYIPGLFEQKLPDFPADARILIVDFSLPRAQALELEKKVKSIRLLDHHQSAADDLGDLPWAHFDMEHSGAYLSWVHFHGSPVPDFIRYLEDRDLWRFLLPQSREVAAALGSYPMDFEVWQGLSTMGWEKLKLDGGTILRYQRQKVNEMVDRARWIELGGQKVPCANASVLFSEVGDRLCEKFPKAPFAAYYYFRDDATVQWGLRSPGRFDVSKVAKEYGGGGHPIASGFVTNGEKAGAMLAKLAVPEETK